MAETQTTVEDRLRAAYEALQRLADRISPELRAELIAAVRRAAKTLDPAAIAKAVAEGNVARAELLARVDSLGDDLQRTTGTIDTAFEAGGALAARELSPIIGTALHFHIGQAAAARIVDQQAARLVTNVTLQTRLAIRTFIRRAVVDGLSRRQTSALIRGVVGLTDRQAAALMNYRTELEAAGLNDAAVTDRAEVYAEKLLRDRAETIARTEILQASNRGQQSLWQQAVNKGLLSPDVEQEWIVTPDDRLCPVCQAMAKQKRALGVPFVSPYNGMTALAPPIHPRCRCALVLARVAAAIREAA